VGEVGVFNSKALAKVSKSCSLRSEHIMLMLPVFAVGRDLLIQPALQNLLRPLFLNCYSTARAAVVGKSCPLLRSEHIMRPLFAKLIQVYELLNPINIGVGQTTKKATYQDDQLFPIFLRASRCGG
jgi:hypothetical protein